MSLLILNQTKREFLKIYHYRNFYILSKTKRSETCDLLIRIKKDESKCQNGGIFFQQIRRLQYKNFGHRPTPPHIISTVWYMIVGGGMFLSIFWDLPIMCVCILKIIFFLRKIIFLI
jgi:hypothetical protein